MAQPFNKHTGRFIFNLCYLTLLIGFFSRYGIKYRQGLIDKGIAMPSIEQLGMGGADVWLFICVVLFVVGYIFKRGIEIQTENELTV